MKMSCHRGPRRGGLKEQIEMPPIHSIGSQLHPMPHCRWFVEGCAEGFGGFLQVLEEGAAGLQALPFDTTWLFIYGTTSAYVFKKLFFWVPKCRTTAMRSLSSFPTRWVCRASAFRCFEFQKQSPGVMLCSFTYLCTMTPTSRGILWGEVE